MTKEKTISVRGIPDELWQEVRVEAAKRRMSINEILIQALKQYLAPKGAKQ
jgi:predicted HicB family RNase H-like nuclease